MIIYGILFLAIVGAAVYTVAGLVLWARNPNRSSIRGPLARIGAIAAVAWASSFSIPFVAAVLGSGADPIVGSAWLFMLIVATMLSARSISGVWGPIAAGTVLAGAVWAAAVGIYVMHAVGWQGLSLDDLQSDDAGVSRIWIGALFFAPGAFVLGFLLGLVSPHVTWRRHTPTA